MSSPAPRLTFAGTTSLLRAQRVLADSGIQCQIVPAPPVGSPCGLALEVPAEHRDAALSLLATAGLRPQAQG